VRAVADRRLLSTGAVALGLALLLVTGLRVAGALREGRVAGGCGTVRLDLALLLALVRPASFVVPPVRRWLGAAPALDERLSWWLIPALAVAITLGRQPGLHFASLAGTVTCVVVLAGACALLTLRSRTEASPLCSAWLVLSCFVMAAVTQAIVLPWIVELQLRR